MNTFVRRLSSDIPLLAADALAWMLRARTEHDFKLAEHPAFARFRDAMKPKLEKRENLAIVPVQGALAYNPDLSEMLFDGVEDSRNVLSMLHQANDDEDVKGVLLRMDTPGGMLLGGPEMADAVVAMKQRKPVIAHAGGICASLGYMIASQATEVIANRSAIVGSIGVIASVADWSGYLAQLGVKLEYFTNEEAIYKGAGAVGSSLTQKQRENIQASVQSAFDLFKGMVQACRPMVKADSMKGQTFRGSEAKGVGLVDRVGDENYALGVLRSMVAKRP